VAKKSHPDNFSWVVIEGTNHAEKAVSIGSLGPRTVHLYGTDEADLRAKIKAFEAEHAPEEDDE
jgi:hypothetical protein